MINSNILSVTEPMVRGAASGKGARGRGANYGRGKGVITRRSIATTSKNDIPQAESTNPVPVMRDETPTTLQSQGEQAESTDHNENQDHVNSAHLSMSSRTRGLNQGFDAPTEAGRLIIQLIEDRLT